MYLDKVKIYIKAGNGGDGHVSFHREKYVQQGGPDGGDGGHGGSVVFIARENITTLLDFRFKKHFRADNGGKGEKRNARGKNAEDLIVEVPLGTLVKDFETGKIIADLHEKDVPKVIAKGGRGGLGNARFATPTRQAPKFAKPGIKTAEHEVVLELKTIADIGLVGMPNVGKSTLLSVITRAKPKIANYHFTTLSPNIGILSMYEKAFVVADIPGLIEGAGEGTGLGFEFLRHVERTRMLLHVLDCSSIEGNDPLVDYETINKELAKYNQELLNRPTIIVCNKMDTEMGQENYKKIVDKLSSDHVIVPISAAAMTGLDELLDAINKFIAKLPGTTVYDEEFEIQEELSKEFTVEKRGDTFYITGSLVQFIFDKVYPDDPDSMRYFQRLLISTGIIAALKEKGAKDGDTINMDDVEFDYVD